MREGGRNCLKCLKRGWKRTEGRGHKAFKRGGGQAGARGECLKKGELEPPYELCILVISKGLLRYAFFVITKGSGDPS